MNQILQSPVELFLLLEVGHVSVSVILSTIFSHITADTYVVVENKQMEIFYFHLMIIWNMHYKRL